MVSASPSKQCRNSACEALPLHTHVDICIYRYIYIYMCVCIWQNARKGAGTPCVLQRTCFTLTLHRTISKIHVMTLDEDILRREASGPWHKPSSHLLRFQHNPTVGRSTWPICLRSWSWESLQSKTLCLFKEETIWIKSATFPGAKISNFQKVAFSNVEKAYHTTTNH